MKGINRVWLIAPNMKARPSKITYTTLFADQSIHPKYETALARFSRSLGKHYPMHIGKEEVRSEAGEFEHRSPLDTSIVVGHFQMGTREHARAAVEAAAKAFSEWSTTPWRERVRIMKKAAGLIDERKFEIATAITYEVGKNRTEALAECWEAMDAIKLYAKIMVENQGYSKKMGPGGPGEDCRLVAKPLGVWPVISPFNFPLMLANGMALGALITGNAVILKPTSEAPLTGLMLYNVFHDAGVPSGAVNYVTGPGSNFEEEFTTNPHIAGIAFTGSKEVGMRLYHKFLSSQPYFKPVVMELGSKNPAIVSAKADLEKAVEGIVRGAYGYCGQKCSATSRVYVQSSVKERFLKELKERLEKLKVGDPREKEVFMGPIINQSAVQKFREATAQAIVDGVILSGGSVITEGIGARGYYVEPTVVTGLPSDHRLFREELFVPLLAVDEFKTLDEAIAKANNTEYGLTAGIFSEDRKEVKKFLDTIQFGVVYANRKGGATTGAWPGAQTFVGWKASGATGKGIGGPNYLMSFLREQSQTVVKE
ncbi:MAG: aldehyde dehydrogenase family protein [Thaumarchaeota archaeon]|nr:aldehyde dehydrogenase family protein [Nitrososphaerota archaeon]